MTWKGCGREYKSSPNTDEAVCWITTNDSTALLGGAGWQSHMCVSLSLKYYLFHHWSCSIKTLWLHHSCCLPSSGQWFLWQFTLVGASLNWDWRRQWHANICDCWDTALWIMGYIGVSADAVGVNEQGCISVTGRAPSAILGGWGWNGIE